MLNNIPTEEQKHVKRILKRWFKYSSVWTLSYTAVMSAAYLLMFKSGFQFDQGRDIVLIIFHLAGLWGITYMLRVGFARQLSYDEQEALSKVQSLPLGKSEAQLIKQLLKESIRSPQSELLRASVEPQDDTLLRAAASTETTAQDQLLRSTNYLTPDPSPDQSQAP